MCRISADNLRSDDVASALHDTRQPTAQILATTIHLIGTHTVMTATGEIDMATAPDFVAALRDATDNATEGVVIDLTPVTFLASAGMSALVFASGLARSRGIGFAVVAVGRATARPLELMELTEALHVNATLDEALSALTD